MNRKASLVAAALLSTGIAHATCYTVYRADGALIQEGPVTPVNMTLPLGDSVPEKFGPGATMTVSDLGVYCRERRGVAPDRKAAGMKARPEKLAPAAKTGAVEKAEAAEKTDAVPQTEAAEKMAATEASAEEGR
jgi:hypothetical protein